MLKVIIDTNVVISGLLRSDSKPELILTLALEKQVELLLSDEIFEEYKNVLDYGKFKKAISQVKRQKFLKEVKKSGTWVDPKGKLNVTKDDPEDNKFLECAVEGKADFIITGNTKHFPFKAFQGVQIVNPSDFLDNAALEI